MAYSVLNKGISLSLTGVSFHFTSYQSPVFFFFFLSFSVLNLVSQD